MTETIMARLALISTLLLLLTLCCRTGSFLTVIPTKFLQYSGRSASIACHFSRCEGMDWKMVQSPVDVFINSSAHYDITRAVRKSVLTIHNLVEADQGQYYCICDGKSSVTSNLIVNHFPHFGPVEPIQNFQTSETAAVICDAFPGDPPEDMFWIRNGSLIIPSERSRLSLDNDRNALIIRNIRHTDSGLYQCAFDGLNGHITFNITVNVVPPERSLLIILPPTALVTYGDSLNLECRTEPNDTSLQFSWIMNNSHQEIGRGQTLVLPANQVVPGLYTCIVNASAYNGNVYHRSVLVSVANAPPCFEILETPITANEFESYIIHKNLKLPLDNNSLHFRWTRNGQDVDFSSRLNFTITSTALSLTVANLQMSDRGRYSLNVSNDYGYAVLNVKINVHQLERTTVQVQFTQPSCNLLEYRDEIATQIARVFESECPSYCGDVAPDPENQPTVAGCQLSVTLISEGTLPSLQQDSVELNIGETAAIAIVSLDMGPTPTSMNQSVQQENTTLVVSIIITLVVLFALAVVLALTILIKKCPRHNCHKDKVEQEVAAPDLDQQLEVVIHQPAHQNQVECIGYVCVNKTHQITAVPSNVDQTSTPVTLPFNTQPPYITAAQGQPCITNTEPQPRAPVMGQTPQPKRPARLFFRSHSYHGSTRTPLA